MFSHKLGLLTGYEAVFGEVTAYGDVRGLTRPTPQAEGHKGVQALRQGEDGSAAERG
jgi:hypothetical protein